MSAACSGRDHPPLGRAHGLRGRPRGDARRRLEPPGKARAPARRPRPGRRRRRRAGPAAAPRPPPTVAAGGRPGWLAASTSLAAALGDVPQAAAIPQHARPTACSGARTAPAACQRPTGDPPRARCGKRRLLSGATVAARRPRLAARRPRRRRPRRGGGSIDGDIDYGGSGVGTRRRRERPGAARPACTMFWKRLWKSRCERSADERRTDAPAARATFVGSTRADDACLPSSACRVRVLRRATRGITACTVASPRRRRRYGGRCRSRCCRARMLPRRRCAGGTRPGTRGGASARCCVGACLNVKPPVATPPAAPLAVPLAAPAGTPPRPVAAGGRRGDGRAFVIALRHV